MKQIPPETVERYTQVWKLRSLGMTFEEIARAVGYADSSGAKRAYDAAAQRFPVESIEQQRLIQSERLDLLLKRVMKQIEEGEISLVNEALRIEKRRADLWGLDAPRKTEVTGADGGAIEIDFVSELLARVDQIEKVGDADGDE
jgi:hypothetical protein